MAGKLKARNIAAIGLTSILIGACSSGLAGGSQPGSIEEEVAARVAATMTAQAHYSEGPTYMPPTPTPTSEPPSIATEPPVTNVTYPGWDGECVLWDQVSEDNIGETLCVYGPVLDAHKSMELEFMAQFSENTSSLHYASTGTLMPDAFIIIDRTRYWPVAPGDCIMAVGEVELYQQPGPVGRDKSRVRTWPAIDAAGQLRLCEIPSGNAAAAAEAPTEPPSQTTAAEPTQSTPPTRTSPSAPTPTRTAQSTSRHIYHDAFDRAFSSVDSLLWTLIEGAPEDWWEPKSEFETQAQYDERMREAEQDYLRESNEFFGRAEDLVYLIYAPGEGSRISGTSKHYDGMVLHPYDAEHNRYVIDLGEDVFVVNPPITLNWDVDSLPQGIEFIDDIDYIDILLNGEENHFSTWIYPDVIRLRAQVPVDVAERIRELDLEDNVTVRFFVQFDFPNNLRSYAWEDRPVEPEPGAVGARILRAELYDCENNVYFVWE